MTLRTIPICCLWLAVGCDAGEPSTSHEGAPQAATAQTAAAKPPQAAPADKPGPAAPGDAKPGVATPGDAHASTAGGLTWDAEAPLTARPPSSSMRAAEYVVAGATPDAGAELTVYYFGPGQGGSVQANLDRWIGQFTQPDGQSSAEAAKTEQRKAGSIPITTLDLTGTFTASMGPMAQAKPGTGRPDQRVLGAIAEGPEGPVFFKLVGPRATVEQAEAAFHNLVDSIKPAP